METRARKRSNGSADACGSFRKRSRNLSSNSSPSSVSNSSDTTNQPSKKLTRPRPRPDNKTSAHASRSNTRNNNQLASPSSLAEPSRSGNKSHRTREQSTPRATTSNPEPGTSSPEQLPVAHETQLSEPIPPTESVPTTEMDRRARAAEHDDREDDADNEDEGAASLSLNLASASSALHGLLRKLGAGLDDLLPNASLAHSRFKGILAGLRAEGDEGRQLEALTSLCELLSIANEDSLSTFSVDSFVPALVILLNAEHSPDTMLLAARALTHLADVLPSACAAIVHYGAVNCFCARLLTIEYIDLAEQSLQALEKLSHEHPVACLRAGGLMAVLSYLDFFSTGVQRLAVTTAANMCRRLPLDASDMVVDCIPILTNLLSYPDTKLVEQACICLSRISESFASSPERIKTLCSQGLIEHAARLVSVDTSSPLSASTYTCMIRLMATCVAGSPDEALKFLQLGMTRNVRESLQGSTMLFSSPASPASMLRSSEQLTELLSLVSNLLPPMPTSATGIPVASGTLGFSSSPSSSAPLRSSPRRRHEGLSSPSNQEKPSSSSTPGGAPFSSSQDFPPSSPAASSPSGPSQPSPREVALQANPHLVGQYGKDLLSVLLQVYGVSTSSSVRQKCLTSISRYLHFASADQLQTLLVDIPISSFIATLLSSKESSVVMIGLHMAEVLMSKLPDLFSKYFLKEGVVHAIEQLASSEVKPANEQDSHTPASVTPSSHTSTRRTSRHKSGGLDESSGGGGGSSSRHGHSQKTPSRSPHTPASPCTPASASTPSTGSLRLAAVVRAQSFKRTYLSSEGGGVTEGMARLQGLAANLRDPNASREKHKQALRDLLAELSHPEGVSTFEFVGSGTVEALKQFFTAGDVDLKKTSVGEVELSRIQLFWEVAEEAEGCKAPPMPSLARKLQDTLTNLEKFPVFLSQGPRGSGAASSSLGSQLVSLTHPFKLRLCRQPSDRTVKDYSTNIVLIEPLATLSAVEDFLWPRVKRSSSSSADGGGAGSPNADKPTSGNQSSPSPTLPTLPTSGSKSTKDGKSPDQPKASGSSFSHLTRLKAKVTPPPEKTSSGSSKGASSSGKEPAETSKDKGKQVASGGETSPASAVKMREGRLTRSATRNRQREESELENKRKVGRPDSMDDTDGLMASPVHRKTPADLDMDEDDMDEDMDEEEEDYYDEDGLDEEEEEEDGMFSDALMQCSDRVHDVQLSDTDATAGNASTSADPSKQGPSSPQTSGPRSPGPAGGSAPPKFSEGHGKTKSQAAEGGNSSSASATAAASAGASGSRRSAAAAAAAAAATVTPHLVFSLDGLKLQAGMTIFQAIQQSSASRGEEEEEGADGDGDMDMEQGGGRGRRQRMWDEIYTVHYRLYNAKQDTAPAEGSSSDKDSKDLPVEDSDLIYGSIPSHLLPLAPLLQSISPGKLNIPDQLQAVLLILRLLGALTKFGHRLHLLNPENQAKKVPTIAIGMQEELVSSKLSSKLSRQLQDVLTLCSGGIPSWCRQLTVTSPFLFPFDARRQYFYCTAFSLSRALQRLQQQQAGTNGDSRGDRDTRELRVGRLQRQKVRVSRTRILDSAAKVMELYCAHKAVLEVEYFGEVGTGLGPTLEFYTLVSYELQKKSLGLWRQQDAPASSTTPTPGPKENAPSGVNMEDLVSTPAGLFPTPVNPALPASSAFDQKLERFRLLGRVMAKALQDGRLLDLPLSPAFYKCLLGYPLDLYDIRSFDPMLGATMEELDLLCRKKAAAAADSTHEDLTFRGCQVEDLGLDFTLPGYVDYNLCPDGASTNVTIANLDKYIQGVVDASVGSGVARQFEAVKSGFQQVFSVSTLRLFNEVELDMLICGCGEKWALETIQENIKCDHGYTLSSHPLQNFLQILVEFGPEDQRAFLRFVTGSPRLPAGGLAALSPKLTIVRKHPSNPTGGMPASTSTSSIPGSPTAGSSECNLQGTTAADNDLPSVMTCANYLKLPPYSCKAIMKERLLFAIHEGSASFDLS